jgi:hypothetical protein
LPSRYIGRRWYAFGKLIRRIQLFILHKLGKSFCTLLIIIQLQEAELGGPDSGAYKLINIALIFWVEEQLAIFPDVLLELFLELNDVFQHEFFLWSV